MNSSPKVYLPPEEMERRRLVVAKGRTNFIVYSIMLRWGLGAFALMTLWSWFDNHGWHAAPRAEWGADIVEGALSLVACAVVSYLYGAWAWRQLEESLGASAGSSVNR